MAAASVALASLGTPLAALGQEQSKKRVLGANGKVNVALVGIGNRGDEVERNFSDTGMINVVAICDVDMGAKHTQRVMNKYSGVKKYKDFRKMFDEMAGQIEAVVVCTPDHSHFPICMRAIKEGIHVYTEKPMARTFLENELLIQSALKNPKVVTQMGNQGHSEANYFQFKEWVKAGIIKDVTAITAHMNSARRWHGWDPNIKKFPDAQPIPETLDWDMWLMTEMYHDFNEKFHPGNWRCWYDFGMGALGDWGAHIIDTAHEFLDLGLPHEIQMQKATGHNDYFFPMSSTILFRFPRRGNMPACDVTWYDGVDNIPAVPDGYGVSEIDPNIPSVAGGTIQPAKLNPGKIIYSKELTFKGGSHGSTLSIIPEAKAKEMASKLPEIPKSPSNHQANFLLACMGKEKTRSPFQIAGVLSQVFSLGVMAQRLNTTLKIDRNTKEITNNPFANAMLTGIPPRSGWEEYYKL